MADQSTQQRLAAVLAADVVGYTRLMEEDSEGTVASWQSARDEIITPTVADHSGRIVKLTGDGFLAEFPTIHEAVNCAIAMQQGFADSNLEFRIGINLGDIIDDGQDIHGEGVNVAARIEALADPGGICISGEAHVMVRNRVDVPYRDMGDHDVKHVSHPVRVYAIGKAGEKDAAPSEQQAINDKPSIAVLPFDNLSGDPAQEYFSDGITEDIITALSRIRQFFVIARNTTFTYKGQAVDVQAIAKDLGVRYVLEGSVRRSGERVRITAQLIDGGTGNHIWAEKYDRDLADIFAVQDEITLTMAGAIGVELAQSERSRARAKSPNNVDTWELFHRTMSTIFGSPPTAQAALDGICEFERVIERDPEFAPAYAAIAQLKHRQVTHGWPGAGDATNDGVRYALKAVELDRQDAVAHAALTAAYLTRGDISKAILAGQMAVELNPSLFYANYYLGFTYVCDGMPSEAIACLEQAIRCSPRDTQLGQALSRLAEANLVLGNFATALEFGHRAVTHRGAGVFVYATLVVCTAYAGTAKELENARRELLDLMPNFSCKHFNENFPASDPDLVEMYIQGLRKAGLPET
jgi:adenylate cyclase